MARNSRDRLGPHDTGYQSVIMRPTARARNADSGLNAPLRIPPPDCSHTGSAGEIWPVLVYGLRPPARQRFTPLAAIDPGCAPR